MAPSIRKRVLVEVRLAVQGHAGQDAVVECRLHGLGEPRLPSFDQEAPRPHESANRRARLGICRVIRKFVVLAERLALPPCPEATGHIRLALKRTRPKRVRRHAKSLVTGLHRDVRKGASEVRETNRMADGFGLFPDREVILMVGRSSHNRWLLATHLQQEHRFVEITAVAGLPEELDHREFDFLVAVGASSRSRTERRADVVGQPDADIQQGSPSSGSMVRDGSLDQVAGAIHLVLVGEISPTVRRKVEHEIRVEVAIGLLGTRNGRDHRFQPVLKFGVGMGRKRKRCRLYPFVHIRIIVVAPVELPADGASRPMKVCDAAGGHQLVMLLPKRDLTHQINPGFPEASPEADGLKGNGQQPGARGKRTIEDDGSGHVTAFQSVGSTGPEATVPTAIRATTCGLRRTQRSAIR